MWFSCSKTSVTETNVNTSDRALSPRREPEGASRTFWSESNIIRHIGRHFAWQHLLYQADDLQFNSSSDRGSQWSWSWCAGKMLSDAVMSHIRCGNESYSYPATCEVLSVVWTLLLVTQSNQNGSVLNPSLITLSEKLSRQAVLGQVVSSRRYSAMVNCGLP